MAAPATQQLNPTPSKNIWLNAWYDPVAGLKTFSSCICLADIYADGDSKLLVADIERKLKIYKGSTLISEHPLLGKPVAMSCFYSDTYQPRTPSIAVASGPFVYIYRNLRPYYKFTSIDLDAKEIAIWDDFSSDKIECQKIYENLGHARDSGVKLSSRSLDVLSMIDQEKRDEYLNSVKDSPLFQQTSFTCMSTLNKSMEDNEAVSCLVLGTENKQVIVLDPHGSKVLSSVYLNGIPFMFAISGLYDVEYRIVAACRNGAIYTIKNGQVMGNVIELESQPCAIIRLEKSIIVAGMDQTLNSFHFKGKRNWTMTMDAPITNLEPVVFRRSRQYKGFLVALAGGTVHLFNEKIKVASIDTEGTLSGMRFGPVGREESGLVLIHKSGGITVKMLQRSANLEGVSTYIGPPPEQDIPLKIPKKTKLYVEQTQRERDQATEMHRIFQKDLCRLRLTTARAYVKLISDGQGSLAISSTSNIRLNAQVQGLGPLFTITLDIQNGGTKTLTNLHVTFGYNRSLYEIDRSLITIPIVIPGITYSYTIHTKSVSPEGLADVILVYICNTLSCIPIVSAVVNMPLSELQDDDVE